MLRKLSPLSVTLILLTLCVPSTISAAKQKQAGGRSRQPELSKRVAAAKGEVIAAADAYIESCNKLLVFQEDDLKAAEETVERRKSLVAENKISERELEESKRMLAAAKAKIEETKRQIAEAEDLKVEAQAEAKLALIPKPAPQKKP